MIKMTKSRLVFSLVLSFALFAFLGEMQAQSNIWINTYYAGWMQGYQDQQGRMTSDKVDYTCMTHISHFNTWPNNDGTLNDVADNGNFSATNSAGVIAKAHAKGVKVIFTVGGWATDGAFRSATSDQYRASFVHNLVQLCRERGYDGVDIDWEPLADQDTTVFRKFINQLYDSLGRISPRPMLNAAASYYYPQGFVPVWQKFNQINIMTYDLSGNWGGWVTWHNTPIYAKDEAGNPFVFPSNGAPPPNCETIVNNWNSYGIPFSKLGIGIDWYGYLWQGGVVSNSNPANGVTKPRQEWTTTPSCGPGGGMPYYQIMSDYYTKPGARRVWDPGPQSSYISIDASGSANDYFISYDDQQSVLAKIAYVRQKGLGGLIVWELGGGYRDALPVGARDSLLQTLKTGVTPVQAPSAPSLVSPANGATGVVTNPTLIWNSSTGADSYRLQVSTNSAFSTLVVDQSGITATSYPIGILLTLTTYYWRVNATNAGGTSAYSSTWTLTTGTAVSPPPSPTLASPTDGSANVSTSPTLTWNAAGGATSYRLQVSTDTSFSATIVNQSGLTATSYAVSGLSTATAYYWHVNATNSAGTSAYSSRWRFTTVDTTAPTVSISAPTGGTVVSGTVTVSATASDNVGVAGVQFKLDGNDLGTEVGSAPYNYSWSTAAFPNGTHTLTAVARDAAGNTKTSSPITVTVTNLITENWIYQDDVVSPWIANAGGSTITNQSTDYVHSGTYSLKAVVPQWTQPSWHSGDWSNVVYLDPAGYTAWEFYVYVTGGSGNAQLWIHANSDSSGSWREFPPSYLGPYNVPMGQWTRISVPMTDFQFNGHMFNQVNVQEGTGGRTLYFDDVRLVGTAGTTPPSPPSLSSPSNGATGTSTNPILTWNASSGATSYGLQVSTSSSFSSTVVNQTGVTTTSYAASGLASNTTYYWRVNAANTGGTSAYSTTWSFTTSGAAPSSPMLSSPSSGTMGVSITPTLSWNASTGATSYRLQVSTSSSFATTVVNQSSITATSYAISGLTGNTTYYWRVNATNAGGTSTYSTAWSFTTSMSHSIVLVEGWNVISSVVQPQDSALDVLLAPIIPQMQLMKTLQGQNFWPLYGLNQIGKWSYLQGYMINMLSADTLTLTGKKIAPEVTSIALAEGPNLIPYFRLTPMQADSALASISDDSLYVKEIVTGQIYWPMLGYNTIGSLTPGKGYFMWVSQNSTLVYPANNTQGPPSILTKQMGKLGGVEVPAPLHYHPSVSNTGANATLVVEAPQLGERDEIAIWTQSKLLAGSGVTSGGKALITVWGDNIATQDITDGAVEGEPLSLTFWSAAEQKEGSLTVSSLLDALTATKSANSVCYKTNAVWIAQAIQVKELPKEFSLSQNYPNPFNPSTVIRYALPNDAMVTLEVFNILGQRVALPVNEEQKAGNHEVVFQNSTLGSGVYFYRLTTGEFTTTKKMVLIR